MMDHRTHRHAPSWARWAATAGLCVALSWASAWAAKPEWAGQGPAGHALRESQGHGHDGGPPGKAPRAAAPVSGTTPSVAIGAFFGEREREAVRIVFGQQVAQGRCPPGLAKKNNGCRPPGLTKPWKLGQPLPAGVTVYPIPRELQRRLGDPPSGYRYVRVAADILLIAIGTSMVVDAIEDLAGL